MTDYLYKAIGYSVRNARIKAGMTQQALGEALGYPKASAQPFVARWEAGSRPIPHAKLRPLSIALKLPLECIVP